MTVMIIPGGERRELWLMGVSAALFAVGMLADTQLTTLMPAWLVTILFYALPYALCGYEVLLSGARSLLRGDFFNEFTLMGGATIAAIILGQLPEAVGVMLFYRIGEYVQERAAGNSRRSVRALLAAARLLPTSFCPTAPRATCALKPWGPATVFWSDLEKKFPWTAQCLRASPRWTPRL